MGRGSPSPRGQGRGQGRGNGGTQTYFGDIAQPESQALEMYFNEDGNYASIP